MSPNTANKVLTKGRPVTPGSIIGYVEVCWSNDIGAVSVQLTLSIRQNDRQENRCNESDKALSNKLGAKK